MPKKIDLTLVILVALLLIVAAIAFFRGGLEMVGQGLVHTGNVIGMVWLRLLLGFTLGGLIQVLVPRNLIAKWLGPTSGIKGILVGSYAAMIMAGAPYVMLPVVASLYAAGAGAAPIIAMMTGQSLISLQTVITWQIPFLGFGIPLSKFIVGLFLTPIVGFLGSLVFKLLDKFPGQGTKGCDTTANQTRDGIQNK